MATGRANQLTKQVGEYLVAAEVCRRGFIATTFTGNVPHYDIIASNDTGRHQAIQVKAIKSRSEWQFDVRHFADIKLDGQRQAVGEPTATPYPDLVCVLVRLGGYGADEFYVLTWEDLQKIAIADYSGYLARHDNVRPKKPESFHMALSTEQIAAYRDKWDVLESRLRGGG